MPSKEEIFNGVKEALVEALAVDDDEVTQGATLVGDLGAESIDLLDIVYRLEKAFGIKIERGELVPDDVVNDQEGKYVQEGKLTALGLAEIKKRMPHADLETFEYVGDGVPRGVETCELVHSSLRGDAVEHVVHARHAGLFRRAVFAVDLGIDAGIGLEQICH